MRDFSELNICIVGAQGRMGTLFKRLWSGKLGQISELNLRPGSLALNQEDIERTVPLANVLILSVPISKLAEVLADIAPSLAPSCLLSDFSSVKILPMRLMQAAHSGPVVGAHPLFGPESFNQPSSERMNAENDNRFLRREFNGGENQVALIAGANSAEADLELMAGLFRLAGCSTFAASAGEHDRAVAIIQSLNFLSNLAYFASAANLPDLEKYITPSFRRRLFASRTMLQEDADLFTNIARHTPQLGEAIQAYRQTLEKAAGLDDKALDDLLLLAGRYFNN